MPTSIKTLLAGLALLGLPLGTSAAAPPPPAKPNVVFVLGDDHGWPFYGFMADEAKRVGYPPAQTPVMDELVRTGVLFPVAHNSSAICPTSIETILTGLHSKDFPIGDCHAAFTIPNALRPAGYRSFGFGKFWTGYKHRGFDEYVERSNMLAGRQSMKELYGFVDRHLKDHPGQPFFAWYGPRLPHVPTTAPGRYKALYPVPPFDQATRDYYGNCSWMDDTLAPGTYTSHSGADVAGLQNFLRSRNLETKTLLLYVSDNGFFLPHSKGQDTENGFRTVLWASLPGRLAAGKRWDGKAAPLRMAHTVDILPTLLDYAGVAAPPDSKIGGRSLRPLLEGRDVPDWRKYLFGQQTSVTSSRLLPTRPYVRTGDGLILYLGRNPQVKDKVVFRPERLYDLALDPHQETNLVQKTQDGIFIPNVPKPYADRVRNELQPAIEGWLANYDWAAKPISDGDEQKARERLAGFGKAIADHLVAASTPVERERLIAFRTCFEDALRDSCFCTGCSADRLESPAELLHEVRVRLQDAGFEEAGLPKL